LNSAWVILSFKRLIKRKSYVFFLCVVMGMVATANCLSGSENSILKIALCKEDNSIVSDKSIKFLLDKMGFVQYLYYDSIADAKKAAENHKVDAVWIFKENLEERIFRYVSKKSTEPFVEIIEGEENTLLRMEREALISSVFAEVSFQLFKNYTDKNALDEAELREIYENHRKDNNFIEIHKLNSEKSDVEENITIAPIKGLSALAVFFAGLMGAMTFLKDTAYGIYDWIPAHKRILPAFVSCFAFTFLTGMMVFTVNSFTSFSQGFLKEIFSILCYIAATTGLCLNFCFLFKSYEKFGAFLPGIITAAAVLSPIFIDIPSLRCLQMVLPLYYYLHSNVDITIFFIYCFFIYLPALMLNYCRCKKQIV